MNFSQFARNRWTRYYNTKPLVRHSFLPFSICSSAVVISLSIPSAPVKPRPVAPVQRIYFLLPTIASIGRCVVGGQPPILVTARRGVARTAQVGIDCFLVVVQKSVHYGDDYLGMGRCGVLLGLGLGLPVARTGV